MSLFYKGYTFVNQVRPGAPAANKGLCWFGPDISKTICFVPFSTKMTSLPAAYKSGSPQRYDRTSAWWAFDLVANWARLNYQRMSNFDIVPLQGDLEQKGAALSDACGTARREIEATAAFAQVTKAYTEHAESVLQSSRAFGDHLLAKYSDGYSNPDDGRAPRHRI